MNGLLIQPDVLFLFLFLFLLTFCLNSIHLSLIGLLHTKTDFGTFFLPCLIKEIGEANSIKYNFLLIKHTHTFIMSFYSIVFELKKLKKNTHYFLNVNFFEIVIEKIFFNCIARVITDSWLPHSMFLYIPQIQLLSICRFACFSNFGVREGGVFFQQ